MRRIILAALTAILMIAGLTAAAPALASTCTVTGAQDACGPYLYTPQITESDGSNTYVNQDVWNAIPGWSQSLTATDPGHWTVTADMPAGNTAVVSYPDVQQLYNSEALSSFSFIRSGFTESQPANSGEASEAAYDIWLNNWANEVMIWTDNQGQEGLQYDQRLRNITVAGQQFTIYKNGSEVIVALDGTQEQSGTVRVLAVLDKLMKFSIEPAGSTLTGVDFGWEISSTGGQSGTFTMSNFWLHDKASAG